MKQWLDPLPIHHYLCTKYSSSSKTKATEFPKQPNVIQPNDTPIQTEPIMTNMDKTTEHEMSNILRRAEMAPICCHDDNVTEDTCYHHPNSPTRPSNSSIFPPYKNNKERFDFYMLEAFQLLDDYRQSMKLQQKLSFIENKFDESVSNTVSTETTGSVDNSPLHHINEILEKYLGIVHRYFPEETKYLTSLFLTTDEDEESLEMIQNQGAGHVKSSSTRKRNHRSKTCTKINSTSVPSTFHSNRYMDFDSTSNHPSSMNNTHSMAFHKKKEQKKRHCNVCGTKDVLVIDVVDNSMICEQCGTVSDQGQASEQVSYRDIDRVNISTKYQYDRVTHFKDCMNQYQGKQNATIDARVYQDLRHEFLQHGLIPENYESLPKEVAFAKITKEHIMLFLKETGHTKHYEDVVLLHHEFTGIPPPDIRYLENILLHDFDELTNLYDQKYRQNDRKNFINTQYILYQLLKRHKFPCRKEDFNILKTIDRKYYHDNITKTLFEDLGWNFHPTF